MSLDSVMFIVAKICFVLLILWFLYEIVMWIIRKLKTKETKSEDPQEELKSQTE